VCPHSDILLVFGRGGNSRYLLLKINDRFCQFAGMLSTSIAREKTTEHLFEHSLVLFHNIFIFVVLGGGQSQTGWGGLDDDDLLSH
jgi:hypothetical protein